MSSACVSKHLNYDNLIGETMQKSFIFSGLCVLATLGIQLGCAKQVTTPKGMPEWTLIKSGLNTVDGNRALYAVGIGIAVTYGQ